MSVFRFSLVLMLVAFLTFHGIFITFGKVSGDEASLALTNAESTLVSAYQKVLEAEEAGANVSGLLVRLNEAGGFLARARMAYTLGDFDEAVRFASSSGDVAVEVQNSAVGLRDLALGDGVQRLWFTLVGSVVGVVLVVLGCFWVWRVFKRRYYRRVLGMKPEVATDES